MNFKDIPKTAFFIPNGHYEYTRIPFDLKNAFSIFERMMHKGLKGLKEQEIIALFILTI